MTRKPPCSSFVAGVGVRAAELRRELVAHGPHEVRRDPARRGLAAQDGRFVDRGRVVRRRVFGARHRGSVAAGQQPQDVVPALDDRRRRIHDELRLPGRAIGVLGDVDAALLDVIADEVVVRRRLRQAGEDGRLGRGHVLLREGLAEVVLVRRLDAVALVAVVGLVEVGGDDLLLAFLALERLRQPDGLDDLLDLPLRRPARVLHEVRGQQAGTDELLGEGRRAATVAAQGVQSGRDDGDGIEPGVLPEGLVLDRGRRIEDDRRDLVERDDLALGVAEPRQLDLARPVVDDRLLGQDDVVHRLRLREGRVRRERREGRRRPRGRRWRRRRRGTPAR